MFDDCLYFNVNRFARAVSRLWDDAYSEFDLAPAHAYLLRLVLAKPGLIQKQISAELCLDKSTVNRFIDKMEKEDYLYRCARDEDQRIAVYPSPKTQSMESRLNEISRELDHALRTLLGDSVTTGVVDQMRQASSRL